MSTLAINQSRPEDITMREDFGEFNLGRQDDDFGDSTFDETGREVLRDADGNFSDGLYNRPSERLSIRDDFGPEGDTTLLGDPNEISAKKLMSAPLNEMDDDDNFGGGFLDHDDDTNESFGGEMDHSIFADGEIFEDPSARQQLEHITSEIESHMDTTKLALPSGQTPVPTEAKIESAEPSVSLFGNSPVTTPATNEMNQTVEATATVLPTTTVNTTMNTTKVNNSTASEQTTLLTNETGTFALPPIESTALGEPRRARRKRKLVIDDEKSIPSDVMKIQMQDTTDITTQLDLAPPTKKLMHWKETGGADKLFALPGRALPSRMLLRLFVRNLHTMSVPEDTGEEPVMAKQVIQQPQNPPQEPLKAPSPKQEINLDSLMAASNHINKPLEVIPEVSDEMNTNESSTLPETSMVDPFLAGIANEPNSTDNIQIKIGQDESDKLSLPLPPIAPEECDMPEDDDDSDGHHPMDDDFLPPVTPYMGPPSVLLDGSQTPAGPVMNPDMIALEQELAKCDQDAEQELLQAMNTASELSAHVAVVAGSAIESAEERRLEKRSKVMLRMLKLKHQQSGWEEAFPFHSLCENGSKKQAASKFYTLLLLRKQGAVDLAQERPYANIMVSKGPNFGNLSEA